MARREGVAHDQSEPVILALHRIAKLLALILAEGKTKTDAILRLSGVGFPPGEIAELLGTTPNTVSVVIHQARKMAKGRKSSRGVQTRG